MISDFAPQASEATSNSSGDRAQNTSGLPCLWVAEDTMRIEHLSRDFCILHPGATPEPGYHTLALKDERSIRQMLRKLQGIPGADIRIFPGELLQFETLTGVMMKAQWVERWLEITKNSPLEFPEAQAIARDALQSLHAKEISQNQWNIEKEELRSRCGVSGFDWNKYIRDLEAEIHGAVNGSSDPDERLKLELQALAKETDPIRFMRRRAEIASHYRLRSADIGRALRYLDEQTKTARPKFMGLDELFELPQTGIDYLIPGMLPVGEAVILVASPKAGKSLLAYDAAYAVATGESDFLGEQTQQGKVLIVQCDESLNTAKGRLFKRGFRREDGERVQFMDSFSLSQLDILEERLDIFRPKLMVIDCLRRIAGKEVSENSAEFADNVYQVKELCTRYNCSLILIHHSNKNQDAVGVERVRGSSAIAGAVWGVWQLDHILKPDPNNKKRLIVDFKDPARILSITARDVEGQRLRIELDPDRNHWVSQGEDGGNGDEAQEKRTHEQRILDLLKSVAPTGMEAIEINQHLNLGRSVYCALNRLAGKRLISTRQSSRDFRCTVYFCESGQPGPEIDRKFDHKPSVEGGSVQDEQGGGHSPSPPIVQDVIDRPQTLTTTEKNLITNSITNRSQTKKTKTVTQSPAKNTATGTQSPDPADLVVAETQALEVGDMVFWSECPAHCSSFAPFEIVSIDGDYAKLDLFAKLVLLTQLSRA